MFGLERLKCCSLIGLVFLFFGFVLVQGPVFAGEISISAPENISALQPLRTGTYVAQQAIPISWRGVLIGADHGSQNIHHDNCYIRIDGGPVLYYTTIPARWDNDNQLPTDPGLLFHLFTRDDTTYTVHATSSLVNGLSSDLSEGLEIYATYDSSGCTEQSVPVAEAGDDQIVQVDTLVTLDATGSYDAYGPDTASLVYRWECYSAPETVTPSDNGQTATTTFTPTTTGHYYFRLSVRDYFDGGSYNRSQVDYVRITVVDNPSDPNLLVANAGPLQQMEVGTTVTLDGSQSKGPAGTTYFWEQTNPLGAIDLANLAEVLGTTDCQEECFQSNYDADADVDGADVALLANNWGGVPLTNGDQPVAQFSAQIMGPHIFRLTVSYGTEIVSETTIVAIHHPNVAEVVTPPPVDPTCVTTL